jgi:ABC-type multidrug transport system fused ATPase/permease subunit
MNIIKIISRLLNPKQKRKVIFLSVFILIGIILEMLGIGILIPVMTIILRTDDNLQNQYLILIFESLGKPSKQNFIFVLLLVIGLFYLFKYYFLVFLNKLQSTFSNSLSATFSQELYEGYMKLPYQYHLNNNTSILLRNLQVDVYQITTVTQAVISLFMEFSVILGMMIMLLIVEPFGALSTGVFLFFASTFMYQRNKRKLLNWGKKRKNSSLSMNKYILEGFGGVKDIKFLGRELFFIKHYNKFSNEFARVNSNVYFLSQIPRLYLELLSIIALIIMVVIQLLKSSSSIEIIPVLSLFMAASFRLIPSTNKIMSSLQIIKFNKPIVEGIYDEFKLVRSNHKLILEDSLKDLNITFDKYIKFNNVEFTYDGANKSSIKSFSLEIIKGTTIGVFGASGAGKSTFIDLLLGILSPTNGEIIVDGNTIVRDNSKSWQKNLGYVPQSIFLSDESIKNNIAFGIDEDHIDPVKLNNAIRLAKLDEFIDSLPEGVNTIVGERGVRISGGQRQRIGIARSLYYDPKILIFDEATSALDNETENYVMESINNLRNTKTLVIVAHRLSTLSNCDLVYELNKGRIVKKGKPIDII